MDEYFEELCDRLKASNKELRQHAIFRLCTSYPSQSAVLILNIIRDKEREEDDYDQARHWLLRRGGKEATMVLLPYLHDEDLAVRCLVASCSSVPREPFRQFPFPQQCAGLLGSPLETLESQSVKQ